MEELSDSLSATGLAGSTKPHQHSTRLDMYKPRARTTDQESRRQHMLKRQKGSRQSRFDLARMIDDTSDEDQDAADADDDVHGSGEPSGEQAMDESADQHLEKKRSRFADRLMIAEPMDDVPADLSRWYACLCPLGKRCLVIAARGVTKAYNKAGKLMRQFSCPLPGGSRKTCLRPQEYCILDAIYDKDRQTFHVLDVMCWRGHPVVDSDFEFRTFWLQSKFAEDMPGEPVAATRECFAVIPRYSCSNMEELQQAIRQHPFQSLSGLALYHCEGHYYAEPSPLLLWVTVPQVPIYFGATVGEEDPALQARMEVAQEEGLPPSRLGAGF